MTLQDLAPRTQPSYPPVVSVSHEGASTVVAIHGEADLFTLPGVVEALTRVIADSDGRVIVDLSGADFVDTATVRAIGRAWEFLAQRDRRLTVRSPGRMAVRVLAFLGLPHIVEPALADALPAAPRLNGSQLSTF